MQILLKAILRVFVKIQDDIEDDYSHRSILATQRKNIQMASKIRH